MRLNGAQIVVECLKEQKVEYIFGYPGAATINIYDELYKNQEYIQHILTSHEQGAAHAADGYARSTGRVGVCMATSGPGATNLVTGIATAYMDSVPMVAITGNVPVNQLGKDSFQEVDIQGITMPVTKHNFMVKDIHQLADVLREAFYIAKSGRPGPVLVDIPKNLTSEETDYEPQIPKIYEPKQAPQIDAAIYKMIEKAKNPMIIAGGGVVRSGAHEELKQFAETLDAGVSSTLMGIGSMPYDHELHLGNIGMHGSLVSNRAINQTDLLIVMGARFSDRVVGKESGFAANAELIHIDIDPAEINKNVRVNASICGDIKMILKEMLTHINQQNHKPWRDYLADLKATVHHKVSEDYLNVPYILKNIAKHMSSDDIVTTDVGQHQMWVAQHYPINKPQKLLTSGGLGTMGYGLGAALGAQLGNPNQKVVMITGDGSFRMNFNEMITAVRHQLPIKIFLMNNATLGMVKQWQDLFYDQRFSATVLGESIDYVNFANSLGAKGYQISSMGEMDTILEEVFSNDKVCLVNCMVKPEANVYPMVPPGKSIFEAIANKPE